MSRLVYCTKNCLTDGIKLRELMPNEEWGKTGEYVSLKSPHVSYGDSRCIGRDVFQTYGEAYAAAEKARLKKLDSIAKQARRVRDLVFKEPTG